MKSTGIGLGLALAMGLCACTARNPKFCGDGTCEDPSLPFCDTDGSLEGTPGTCIAVSCEAGTFESCRGDDTLVCNATGDNYDIMHCDTGCKVGITTCNPCRPGDVTCGANAVQTCGADGLPHDSQSCDVACIDAPNPHCGYLEPKYLPDACDDLATDLQLDISSSATLSTDLDVNCNGGIVKQNAGPDLCVLRYGTIAVEDSVTLTVTGARALVMIADTSLAIDGTIDISGSTTANGPGGNVGNAGAGGSGTTGVGDKRGGGGAGFATAGGDGTGALGGGAASTNPALLTSLIGGASGGNNGGTRTAGGAMSLVACRGTLSVGGTIDAGGGGGVGIGQFSVIGAAGGGSGGNVVLQGLQVSLTGQLYANGGGGGGGNASGVTGQKGQRSTSAASGGSSGMTDGGGNGGAVAKAPTNGNATNGAGGGSVGFLQTYTPAGVTPTLTPTVVSPALQPNLTVPTR
jgi:hypothetical protein